MSEPDEIATLEGALSVRAALDSRSRDIAEIRVAADGGSAAIERILGIAERRRIAIRRVARDELDATGTSHGGIVATVGPRRLLELAELSLPQAPFVAMLDGVEDPYNFGQAVRSLYAAGADALVVRRRNWMSAAATVARASAGASERITTVAVDDAAQAVAQLRERGLLFACAHRKDATPIAEATLTGSLFVVIGGERRGISRTLARDADLRLVIPYGRRFDPALDTTSAAAVIAFEVARQRRGH
ncbi:MAG TPA: TrmH family RNA methyltransferase [Mycobacteriales bacterium]|jgi:23S rRNA (guanosine2251-2'-O)-methyltransferase|nr:TrmH family RNA methyltransferase [Mycobacteriales bacterium]